jgi:hypothetical protein
LGGGGWVDISMSTNGHLKNECNFSHDTRILINDMHTMVAGISEAQKSMAVSAGIMATTNAKAETRYEKLENMLEGANERASGKGQMPISSHLIIVATILLSMLLVISYTTKQTVEGTINSLKIGTAQK